MKVRYLLAAVGVATLVPMSAVSRAKAADEWFVLSEQTLKSADPSAEIKSTGGRWEKDVKQVKIAVEGADVQITNLVLNWDNRRDDAITDVGTLKAGGQTAPKRCAGAQGAPHRGDGKLQDPWRRADGHAQGLGI